MGDIMLLELGNATSQISAMMGRLTLLRGLGLLEVGGEGWLEGDLRKLSPCEMLLPAAKCACQSRGVQAQTQCAQFRRFCGC